jgi:hypothetical protein
MKYSNFTFSFLYLFSVVAAWSVHGTCNIDITTWPYRDEYLTEQMVADSEFLAVEYVRSEEIDEQWQHACALIEQIIKDVHATSDLVYTWDNERALITVARGDTSEVNWAVVIRDIMVKCKMIERELILHPNTNLIIRLNGHKQAN